MILGPELCPYDLLKTVTWLLTTRVSPLEKRMLLQEVHSVIHKITVKISFIITLYDYIQTVRALRVQFQQ